MAIAYRAVGWNRQKRLYDLAIAAILATALLAYGITILLREPATTPETFIIRFTSIASLILLHAILAIGPLARLDRRFLPLLYNRRHLGVTTFFLALAHGVFAIIQFHARGDKNPLVSALVSYGRDYLSFLSEPQAFAHFPFEALGMAALLILFLMAATSHDFWLRNLGASVWKSLHMFVYAAYALVLAHVFLGALQSERSPWYPAALGAGFLFIVSLHLAAFCKERAIDRRRAEAGRDGYIHVATKPELVEGHGHVAVVAGKRVALVVQNGRIFALSNVCRHQGGPLGEGRVVSGCLTCPWHGYQYRVDDGCSPPPFSEVVPTYAARAIGDAVYVKPEPLPLRTKSEGVLFAGSRQTPSESAPFYIGWQARSPRALASHTRMVFGALIVIVPVILAGIAWFQNPIDPGRFEFGVQRTFEGTLLEAPLPLLRVAPPGEGSPGGVGFLLTGAGKHGPPDMIHGHGGQRVRFRGTLVQRNGFPMIEMNAPESFEVIDARRAEGADTPGFISLGLTTLTGELVDTKCFLGVMRPGAGKVHRGCAVRCLSGGVPPGLLVRDSAGNGVLILLAGPAGKAPGISADWAGRQIACHGLLELHAGTPVLRVYSARLAD